MDIPESIVESGLDQAWKELDKLDPEHICLRSGAAYDSASGQYSLLSFGQQIAVSPDHRSVQASSEVGRILVEDLGELFILSLVWYLVEAKDAACTGRLVRPTEIPGGDMFARGTHVLPLDRIAARFGGHLHSFFTIGEELAADRPDYGDAALTLRAFPKVQVTVVLWAGDEELPAKASLLFDSTAHLHLPVDILWSTAMISLQLLRQADHRL